MNALRLLLGFAGALLLLFTVWTYATSSEIGYARHASIVQHLGLIEVLNGETGSLTLESRQGMMTSYDLLTQKTARLDAAIERLGKELGTEEPSLTQALEELATAAAERATLIDRFKSDHSVYRNSLQYLPTAQAAFVQSWGAVSSEITSETYELVQRSVVLDTRDDAIAAQQRSLAKLQSLQSTLPAEAQSSLKQLLSHAAVLASRKPRIRERVVGILASPVRNKLQEVRQLYQSGFRRRIAQVERRSRNALAWAVLPLLGILLLGYKLLSLYADLERRVAKRTEELERAVSALWGEMELAKRIQEALLPKEDRPMGFNVAARMQPADEVGGDYFDFVQQPDRDWILIGDVSGHGVEAGLVTMMCQTATRAVLCANPRCAPAELLSTVNQVLTHNIRALGGLRYMSVNALCSNRKGDVVYSGAHQDLWLYRSGTGAVESHPSRGAWLGIKQDISGALHNDTLHLAPGDSLILHTDGITEAQKDGKLFDSGGLRSSIAAGGKNPPDRLVDSVFETLEQFASSDDKTLIVLQRQKNVNGSRGART